jgi:peroxiredoxin
MNRITPLILLTLLLSISSLGQISLQAGSVAPAFTGTSLDGSAVDLNELKGNVVVLTFWSTRCAICHHERPKLNQVSERYNSKKVVFLALSMENEQKISGYLRNNPFKSQIVPDSFGTVLKYADRDRNGNLDMGFPSYFVIDQDGVVRHRSSGYDKTAPLDAAIGKLVSK